MCQGEQTSHPDTTSHLLPSTQLPHTLTLSTFPHCADSKWRQVTPSLPADSGVDLQTGSGPGPWLLPQDLESLREPSGTLCGPSKAGCGLRGMGGGERGRTLDGFSGPRLRSSSDPH